MVRPTLESYRMTAIESEPLALDVRGVAALLNCSPRHVWGMNAAGKMPAPLRLGRSVRWRREEIGQWLAAGAPDRETWEGMKGGGDDH